jgi:hypothetical protein
LQRDHSTLERDLEEARSTEVPDASLCLKIARAYAGLASPTVRDHNAIGNPPPIRRVHNVCR